MSEATAMDGELKILWNMLALRDKKTKLMYAPVEQHARRNPGRRQPHSKHTLASGSQTTATALQANTCVTTYRGPWHKVKDSRFSGISVSYVPATRARLVSFQPQTKKPVSVGHTYLIVISFASLPSWISNRCPLQSSGRDRRSSRLSGIFVPSVTQRAKFGV